MLPQCMSLFLVSKGKTPQQVQQARGSGGNQLPIPKPEDSSTDLAISQDRQETFVAAPILPAALILLGHLHKRTYPSASHVGYSNDFIVYLL
jgi:hypothetical protein